MQVQDITPAQWLLIDAASQFGIDKEHFSKRLEFGRELLPLLEQTDVSTPEEIKLFLDSYIEDADEPEMFCASLLAIRDVMAGRPTHYMVGLDAASSGPQILSCLCRCMTGMMNTGAIDSGEVPDLYTLIKNNMGFDAPRSDVKKATVPYVYGSKVAPINVFNDKYLEFIKAYRKVVPWAEWAKNTLIAAWNEGVLFNEWELPDGGTAHIRIIGKEKVKGYFKGREYTYMYDKNKTKKKGELGARSLGANVTHSYDGYILRELHRRCNYDRKRVLKTINLIESFLGGNTQVIHERNPKKKAKALRLQKLAMKFNNFSVRIMDYIDTYTLVGMKPEYLENILRILKSMLVHESFEVRTIHDEFAACPNHVSRMKEVYNELLAEAYESTWLMDIIQQLTGKSFHNIIDKPDPEVAALIRSNTYALN